MRKKIEDYSDRIPSIKATLQERVHLARAALLIDMANSAVGAYGGARRRLTVEMDSGTAHIKAGTAYITVPEDVDAPAWYRDPELSKEYAEALVKDLYAGLDAAVETWLVEQLEGLEGMRSERLDGK